MKPPAKNPITIDLLVICDLAQVTQDGKLSILGIFEQILAESVPVRYPRFFIVAVIRGEPGSEHSISFAVTDSQGNDVIQQYRMMTKLGYNGIANVLNDMTGTIFSSLGTHTVTLTLDGTVHRSIHFSVIEKAKALTKKEGQLAN